MGALLTQHHIRISTTPAPGKQLIPIDWDKASGGDITYSITKMRRSAMAKKEVMSGDAEIDNITLEGFIDPQAHGAWIASLKGGETYAGTTITLTPLDNAGIPQESAKLVYTGCQIAKFTPPQADANGEDAAKLVIEWAVGA